MSSMVWWAYWLAQGIERQQLFSLKQGFVIRPGAICNCNAATCVRVCICTTTLLSEVVQLCIRKRAAGSRTCIVSWVAVEVCIQPVCWKCHVVLVGCAELFLLVNWALLHMAHLFRVSEQ